MSEFGNYLKALLPPNGSAKEIALRMGIDSGMLSRFMRGERRSCNLETLERMCMGVSPNRTIQAGLLAAYLRDQRVGPAKELVEISIARAKKTAKPKADPYRGLGEAARMAALDVDCTEALVVLARQSAQNSKLRRAVMDLASIAESLLPEKR